MTDHTNKAKPSLGDMRVVRELFEMASDEVLFRLVSVSTGKMTADRARDMDDALAKHLARALMGENPEFSAVAHWSGIACARSLKAAAGKTYAELFGEAEPDNPRVLMVQAATVFYREIYRVIREEIVREEATQETVKAAMAQIVDRYALAAVPAPSASA